MLLASHASALSIDRSEFQSEFAKKHQALGRAEGEAEGQAKAVLRVLEARGIAVTDEQRAQVLATTELATLDRWLVRAVTSVDTAEVLAG